MNAIPTRYNGVQFRSRLEARWAAMFDLIGWEWEYEPIDLDGYIPDFTVNPHEDSPILIEVKPIVHWPCPVPACVSCDPSDSTTRDSYDCAIEKIEKSGWEGRAFLAGAVLIPAGASGLICILRSAKAMSEFGNTPNKTLAKCRRCPGIFLAEDTMDGLDWRTTCHCCDSDSAYGMPRDPTPLWREAGNRVQWRSPRGAHP